MKKSRFFLFFQLLRGYIVYVRRLQSTVPKKMATGTFLAYENPKTAHKNVQKRSESFKPWIHNFVSTGMNFATIWLSMCANGSARFTRYCGKMYSRHLFPYGALQYGLTSWRGGDACVSQ